MKKIYLLATVLLFFSAFLYAQTAPKFVLTKDGIKPVIITFEATKSADVIYSKVKEWINLNYKYPSSVIKVDTRNSLIKFSCHKDKAWKIRDNNFDYWNELTYTLTVEIKDAKCRITFATDETRYKVWFNKDGALIPKFKESKSTFETTVNETLASLYNHLKSTNKKAADDW